MTDFTHFGRAANCACKDMDLPKCPDCNHALTDLVDSEGACVVCGRIIKTTETIAREKEISLTVHDAGQKLTSNHK